MYRDKDGTGWIIDYWTRRHKGTDIEGFLNRDRERSMRLNSIATLWHWKMGTLVCISTG